jgi:hypothetical protein
MARKNMENASDMKPNPLGISLAISWGLKEAPSPHRRLRRWLIHLDHLDGR